jgi:hypothetical protein
LKIDVEGAEMEVFRGAERILKKQKPALLFECESRHIDSGDISPVFHFLSQFGYSGSFFMSGARIPVAELRPEVHQKQDGDQFWQSPTYCNNFLFI